MGGRIIISQKISSNRGCDIGEIIPHIVQTACAFKSVITFEVDDKKVNAKSIMGLMTLGLRAGESVTVHADGSDEEDAVAKIEAYLTGRAVINARA